MLRSILFLEPWDMPRGDTLQYKGSRTGDSPKETVHQCGMNDF